MGGGDLFDVDSHQDKNSHQVKKIWTAYRRFKFESPIFPGSLLVSVSNGLETQAKFLYNFYTFLYYISRYVEGHQYRTCVGRD